MSITIGTVPQHINKIAMPIKPKSLDAHKKSTDTPYMVCLKSPKRVNIKDNTKQITKPITQIIAKIPRRPPIASILTSPFLDRCVGALHFSQTTNKKN